MNDHDNVIKFVSSLTSIAAETDLSGHRLFKCTSGDCVESKGYVLGGTDATAKIYSNFGENWAPVTDGACAADGDIGNTYLATSKIQLCMPISGTPTKTDVAASSYLLKKANTSYKKYTGNAATSTIVIMEEPGKKFIKFFFHFFFFFCLFLIFLNIFKYKKKEKRKEYFYFFLFKKKRRKKIIIFFHFFNELV